MSLSYIQGIENPVSNGLIVGYGVIFLFTKFKVHHESSDNFALKRKQLEETMKDVLTLEELTAYLEDSTSYGSTFFVPREARWECEDNGDG